MSLKLISAVLCAYIFLSCGSTPPTLKTRAFSKKDFYARFPSAGEKGIIISCVRCGCFNNVMHQYLKNEPGAFKELYIAADSSCGKFASAQFVSQRNIDNLSEDFYNVILFKMTADNVVCRIVETKESTYFGRVCKSFFN